MKTPSIVALDIDGTIIGSDKKIPAFTASEIHRVADEYGAYIALITARGPQSTEIIEAQLGTLASYVTFGGCLVWAREADGGFTALSESPLGWSTVKELVAVGTRFPVHIGVYGREEWHVNTLDYWGLREARNTSVWPTSVDELKTVLSDDRKTPIFKIMFRGEGDALDALEVELRRAENALFIHRLRHVIEITPASAVKLPALKKLTTHLGLQLTDVIAFGDSASDIEMLENVGIGVLMANASDSLPVASHLERTLSNDEDGVGVALRKFFPTCAPFRT